MITMVVEIKGSPGEQRLITTIILEILEEVVEGAVTTMITSIVGHLHQHHHLGIHIITTGTLTIEVTHIFIL